jgi:hypothetical protein
VKAERYFGKAPSLQELADALGVPKKAIDEIVRKGEGAYYSSGSRPNVTAREWGVARAYAVAFGGKKARKADAHIVEKYNIPVLSEKKGGGIPEAEAITRTRDFPENYPADAVNIIKKMTFSKGEDVEILGSMSFRSMRYASDYDLMESPNRRRVTDYVSEYKEIIRSLRDSYGVYIGDIKCGRIPEWDVVDETAFVLRGKVYGYDYEKSVAKTKQLKNAGVITAQEEKEVLRLLVKTPTAKQLREIIKKSRFGVLRWRPADVLRGKLRLRNGSMYPLSKAIRDPSLFKMDVIALMENSIFQEFSVIYDLRVKGLRLNTFPVQAIRSIAQDVQYYASVGSWFKATKRLFSYANYNFKYKPTTRAEMATIIEKCYRILNSDLGAIYTVIQDIQVLLYLIENHDHFSTERLRKEIDGFRVRLSDVYSVNAYLEEEPEILRDIHAIVNGNWKDPERITSRLLEIDSTLSDILNKETHKRLQSEGLLSVMLGGVSAIV